MIVLALFFYYYGTQVYLNNYLKDLWTCGTRTTIHAHPQRHLTDYDLSPLVYNMLFASTCMHAYMQNSVKYNLYILLKMTRSALTSPISQGKCPIILIRSLQPNNYIGQAWYQWPILGSQNHMISLCQVFRRDKSSDMTRPMMNDHER